MKEGPRAREECRAICLGLSGCPQSTSQPKGGAPSKLRAACSGASAKRAV